MKMSKPILIAIIAAAMFISVIVFVISRQEKVSDRSMTIIVNGRSFTVVLYDNKTADELYSHLPLELDMNELNGNEKYYNFSDSFTASSKVTGHISKGDIKLYGDDCLVLFYDSFSSGYSYTDIGYIEDTTGLEEVLGNGNVTVRFSADADGHNVTPVPNTSENETVSETTFETATKQASTTVAATTTISTTSATTTSAAPTTTTTTSTTTSTTTKEQTTTSEQPPVTEPPAQSEEVTTTEIIPEEEFSLKMEIAGIPVTVDWEDNASVKALKDLCQNGGLTIQMSMYGGFEQVGSIGTSLPREDVQTTTSSGDIVLYSGDQIVVFYGSNSWSYTRLGHITDSSGHSMEELLGSGDVSLTISLG